MRRGQQGFCVLHSSPRAHVGWALLPASIAAAWRVDCRNCHHSSTTHPLVHPAGSASPPPPPRARVPASSPPTPPPPTHPPNLPGRRGAGRRWVPARSRCALGSTHPAAPPARGRRHKRREPTVTGREFGRRRGTQRSPAVAAAPAPLPRWLSGGGARWLAGWVAHLGAARLSHARLGIQADLAHRLQAEGDGGDIRCVVCCVDGPAAGAARRAAESWRDAASERRCPSCHANRQQHATLPSSTCRGLGACRSVPPAPRRMMMCCRLGTCWAECCTAFPPTCGAPQVSAPAKRLPTRYVWRWGRPVTAPRQGGRGGRRMSKSVGGGHHVHGGPLPAASSRPSTGRQALHCTALRGSADLCRSPAHRLTAPPTCGCYAGELAGAVHEAVLAGGACLRRVNHGVSCGS